jgi:LmbE family N-acetylglucosaminyl deacetylase
VVVLSAHPDDEILALGGLLHRLARLGSDVRFVVVTDGEASHPDSRTHTSDALAVARRTELRTALSEVGFAHPDVTHLGLPDSGISAYAAKLRGALRTQLAEAAVVLCPWRSDGHPDHEILGSVVAGLGGPPGEPEVWEYPVWAWHWAQPGDRRLPWARARTVALSAQEVAAKAAAILRFTTQIAPLSPDPADAAVLPPEVLAHFQRDFEVVFK